MKYIILIGDGMADEPLSELNGRTPLEYAKTPNMDRLARSGGLGLFRTVPEGYPPGSDVANLSILGYPPKKYYTGRAPLEAASMGVELGPEDTAFRCNLVTLSEKDGTLLMEDYSAGHISTEEAGELIRALESALRGGGFEFYAGKSYRHLVVWRGGPARMDTTPPHDISGKEISGFLPKGEGSDKLIELMERSREVLKDHPVNARRKQEGKRPATSIWLWGQGRRPSMPTFRERFGVEGSIISAVDLMKGIGIYAGLEVIDVPGATGYLDTNYKGKARYALKSLEEKDLVCVHVEAPDEAGHNGSLDDKIRAIEDFDSLVVGQVLKGLENVGDYSLLVLTDHPTPVKLKTHTSAPVPFVMCGKEPKGVASGAGGFSEPSAEASGLFVEEPEAFMERFLKSPIRVS